MTAAFGEALQLDCGADAIQVICAYHGWPGKPCMSPPYQISLVQGHCEYRNNCTVVGRVTGWAEKGIGRGSLCIPYGTGNFPPSIIRYR